MWTPDRGFKNLEAMIDRDMRSKYSSRTIFGVEIDVVDELDEEDRTICFYCGDWEPEDKHIYFAMDGKVECCCEKCLFGLIEEDEAYEDAMMVIRNRIGSDTGILAVDLCADQFCEHLEKANIAKIAKDSAHYHMKKLREVGA